MSSRVGSVLAPVDRIGPYWSVGLGTCLGLFCLTFLGYGTGIFATSGGLVWVPWDAAWVGVVAGFGIGYLGAGLLLAWGAGVAALLGAHADHALGLSGRSPIERIEYFVRLDGLAFYAVEGVLIGTVAFVAGSAIRMTVRFVSD